MDEDKIKKMSIEQYFRENKELLLKKFESMKGEEVEIVVARNPEDPNETMELSLYERQVEELNEFSIEYDIPREEMAYIVAASGIQNSENITVDERQQIKEFLNRQMKRIENNVKEKLYEDLKDITILQLKNKLIELYSIPMSALDMNELRWRKEYKKKPDYKDANTYVKINFVSMLKSLGEKTPHASFEEYLKKKKPELRKLKDSDFASVTINTPLAPDIDSAIDEISQKYELDRMETMAASMEYGMEAIERIIEKKGIEYTKCLIDDFIDANKRGDFEKMRILLVRMRKDAM